MERGGATGTPPNRAERCHLGHAPPGAGYSDPWASIGPSTTCRGSGTPPTSRQAPRDCRKLLGDLPAISPVQASMSAPISAVRKFANQTRHLPLRLFDFVRCPLGPRGAPAPIESNGVYRLPFADGTTVKVFDDFTTHRPRSGIDVFATAGDKPYRVVAAAAGRVMAIQDGYSAQQSGRAVPGWEMKAQWDAQCSNVCTSRLPSRAAT